MAIVRRGKTWQVQARVGKDGGGRWIRRSVTCDTRAEAERAERRLLAEAEQNRARFVEPTGDALGSFLDGWLEREAPRLRPTTAANYESMARVHIKPALGSARLSELSPRKVQGFLDSMGSRARTEDCRKLLVVVLKDAERLGYVSLNAASRTRAPHREKPKRTSFDMEELAAILHVADTYRGGYRIANMIRVAAYTGLRRGELLGLKWSDVDSEGAELAVRRQVVALHGRGVVRDAPKTAAGMRTVPLFLPALAALKTQQAKQRKAALVTPWVFASSKGGVESSPDNVDECFRAIIKRTGLAPRPFHALRHTAASILLSAGIEPAQAAKVMGHASLATFYSVYADLLPQAGQNVRRQVDAFLAGEKPKKNRAR